MQKAVSVLQINCVSMLSGAAFFALPRRLLDFLFIEPMLPDCKSGVLTTTLFCFVYPAHCFVKLCLTVGPALCMLRMFHCHICTKSNLKIIGDGRTITNKNILCRKCWYNPIDNILKLNDCLLNQETSDNVSLWAIMTQAVFGNFCLFPEMGALLHCMYKLQINIYCLICS